MDHPFQIYAEQLNRFFSNYDREGAIAYVQNLLKSGTLSVVELYEQVLAPCLNRIVLPCEGEDSDTWQEHITINIIRSIIESCYPFVQTEKNIRREGVPLKVLLLNPEEEFHDLGARMGVDFYTMLGDDVIFLGANIARDSFLSAYRAIQPDIVVISVTNLFHLITLQKAIIQIQAESSKRAKIVISGSALHNARVHAAELNADAALNTFEQIQQMRRDFHTSTCETPPA